MREGQSFPEHLCAAAAPPCVHLAPHHGSPQRHHAALRPPALNNTMPNPKGSEGPAVPKCPSPSLSLSKHTHYELFRKCQHHPGEGGLAPSGTEDYWGWVRAAARGGPCSQTLLGCQILARTGGEERK